MERARVSQKLQVGPSWKPGSPAKAREAIRFVTAARPCITRIWIKRSQTSWFMFHFPLPPPHLLLPSSLSSHSVLTDSIEADDPAEKQRVLDETRARARRSLEQYNHEARLERSPRKLKRPEELAS